MQDSRGQKRLPTRITRTVVVREKHYRYRGKSISYALSDQVQLIRRLGGLRGTDKFRVEYQPSWKHSPPGGTGWFSVKKGLYSWTTVTQLRGSKAGQATDFCTVIWAHLFGTSRKGFVRIIAT